MRAAVVRCFDKPPVYDEFPVPVVSSPDEVLVEVLAAGLHPRVRSSADGSHYTSEGVLPLVPGIDGVGRTADGELLYFVAPDEGVGTMAELAVVDRRRAVVLPAGTDPVLLAAAMNPAMSSWLALRRRIGFSGGSVLVLGATGNAGRLAVQVARHLGAEQVVAAGRSLEKLSAVEADATITLDDLADPDRAGRVAGIGEVDVVLDYLWGSPTERAMVGMLRARVERARPLMWVQLGSVVGREITLPSYLLRAAAVSVSGSGQGSIATRDIVAELPELAAFITAGGLTVDPVAVPLADVEKAWGRTDERVVLVP